jgi:hypothetical protein
MKKKGFLYTGLLIFLFVLILTGCGGGGSGSNVTVSGGGYTANAASQQKIIFAGDSAAGRCQWSSYFGFPIENRGVDGQESSQLVNLIQGMVTSKPEKIFITTGGNDVFNRRENLVAGDVDMIIAEIRRTSPSTKIFFHSILPIKTDAINGTIERVNDQVQAVCNGRGVRFISTYNLFKSSTTVINLKYYTADGIHLNEAGYKVWADFIKGDVLS